MLSQYGPVGVIAAIFAAVIVVLWKQHRDEVKARIEDHKQQAGVQAKHDVQIETLRTEYERKHREVVEGYAKALREERDGNRKHEDLVRREFAELMEAISAEAGRSSDAVVTVLNKFYDRFIGPGRNGRGGR